MEEYSQRGVPQQLPWQYGNASHPRAMEQKETGLCWGAFLAGWEGTEIPES